MALIEQDDVARLFRGLVTALNARDPQRLTAGFQVAEIYQRLVPYRTHRDVLGFSSNQDYEAAVLGLLAGIGGYATLEPSDAQATLAAEAESPNPDPTLFREFAGARVRLSAARVRTFLEGDRAYAPAPPEPPPSPEPPAAADTRPPVFELAPTEPVAPAAPPVVEPGTCPACAERLPTDRPVVFCPFCGRNVGVLTCVRCGDELDAAWRFCPRCGQATSRGDAARSP